MLLELQRNWSRHGTYDGARAIGRGRAYTELGELLNWSFAVDLERPALPRGGPPGCIRTSGTPVRNLRGGWISLIPGVAGRLSS